MSQLHFTRHVCYQRHIGTALMLIEQRASIAEKNTLGATPLYVACQEGHTDTALMLIEQGSNITEKKYLCQNSSSQGIHGHVIKVILVSYLLQLFQKEPHVPEEIMNGYP